MNFPILSILTFFPILSAILLIFIKFKNQKNFLIYGLVFSTINFFFSLYSLNFFNKFTVGFQLVEKIKLFSSFDIKYIMGVDGISIVMIILTTFLIPICFLISFDSIKNRVKEYVFCFLLLEGLVIGSFCALDLMMFYIFFEAMLIPMFILIGIYGGVNRIYASYKFFLYTLFGSVIFLIAIISIFLFTQTTDIEVLAKFIPTHLAADVKNWLWLAFFISFAIKVPMFPFHTWLPDAHVQAPTAGSVILAGILIKLGAYAMIRFLLPFFPESSIYFADLVVWLSVIAIIYGSLVALMQEDMKKMIAYSSVAHMGFVTIGIFSFNHQGIDGAIMQMISHGLVSAALFICVGVIYDRLHTKQIADLGGICEVMPNFTILAMIFTMASVGLPATSGFVGEFLAIIGAFKYNKLTGFLSAIGVILGACYMLWLFKRVWYGEITNNKISSLKDLNYRELISLSSMAFLVILIGIMPSLVMNFYKIQTNQIVNIFVK
jgi:NADH-quinone oxidoreductase subunit M